MAGLTTDPRLNSKVPYHTNGPVRPQVPHWDGPFFRLFQCGIDYSTTPWKPHAMFLDAVEPLGGWVYVLQGALIYEVGGERHRVSAGDALVTRHPNPGWFLRPTPGPLHTLWIHVTGEMALRVFDFLHLKYGTIVSLPRSSDAVKHAAALIREVHRHPEQSAHHWSRKTHQWLDAWWQAAASQRPAGQERGKLLPKDSRLVSYAPGTVKNFAQELGYSRSYLTRKLTSQWNNSPGKVLRGVRLDEAARMLRTSRTSIAEIAAKVGYSGISSFTRAFSRKFKQTPASYRRENL